MAITFNEIPRDLLVPGAYIEFDPSRAGTLSDASVILYVGEMKSEGTADLNTIHRIQSESNLVGLVGKDSMLYNMAAAGLRNNHGCQINIAPVEDENTSAPLDIEPLIEAMGDDQYDYVANPYNDSAVLTQWRDECNRRFHANQANRTHVFCISDAGFDALDTQTEALNSSHITFLPVEQANEALYLWLAIFVAITGDRLHNDPAAPLTDVLLPELTAPGKLYSTRETNENLHAGISAWRAVGDAVYIRYVVTTYRKNAAGDGDTAYRDIQVPEILKRFRRRQTYEVNKTYISAGYKLAADASQYGAGQKVVDPTEIAGFLYAKYVELFMREYGWMQKPEEYRESIITEIDPDNDDRINYVDTPYLIGQFRILAGKSQFITR